MKFVSWNVNGLRACVNKGFLDTFHAMNADFFCLQETKLQAGQIELDLPGYEQYWCYAEKKGYSGTAIFTKHTPRSVRYGVGVEELDTEGRLITLEYDEFFLVCCYTPNAQRELARIDHRLRWEAALQDYLAGLDAQKPVIYCGDLNVAHKEIDLKNPSANRGNAGFSDEERTAFSALLARGFTDSFRRLYPDVTGAYSWWSYMFNARKNNAGWRIDYFVVSDRLAGNIHDATIHPDVMGSDHCPVGLDLNIPCNGSIWTTDTTTPCEQSEKKADGESSAGHIRRLIPVAVSLVLTTALLIPIFALRSPTGQDSTVHTTVSTMPPLVSEIIDHGDTIVHTTRGKGTVDNPIIIDYFTNCETSWELVPTGIGFSDHYNFYYQLVFDESYHFSDENHPNIHIENHPRSSIHFYYDYHRNIAGCFVSAYTESDTTLNITMVLAGNSPYDASNPYQITIDMKPSLMLSDWAAEEIFYFLKNQSDLRNGIFSSQSKEMLIDKNAYVQEFATRPEAISILLYDYEYYGNAFSVSYLLLTSELFQSIMNPLEQRQFLELVAQKQSPNDDFLYGAPIEIPI